MTVPYPTSKCERLIGMKLSLMFVYQSVILEFFRTFVALPLIPECFRVCQIRFIIVFDESSPIIIIEHIEIEPVFF